MSELEGRYPAAVSSGEHGHYPRATEHVVISHHAEGYFDVTAFDAEGRELATFNRARHRIEGALRDGVYHVVCFKPAVTKEAFWNDMNRHGNTRYFKRRNYIIEAERHWGGGGMLRVWEAVGDNPTNEDNSYRWTLRGRETFDDADEMATVAVTEVADDPSGWAKEHRPDNYETHWLPLARSGEWSRARRERGR